MLQKTYSILKTAFNIFNKKYFNNSLEMPMITIQKAKRSKNGYSNLGWITTHKVWISADGDKSKNTYEINISAEGLNRDNVEVFETLLHEMVHYHNIINDVKDCSGKVHNKKFKEAAERVGIVCEKDKSHGWITSCGDGLRKFITDSVIDSDTSFEYFRNQPVLPYGSGGTKNKRIFKYTCPECNSDIRGKKDMNIMCADCDTEFVMEE